MPGLIRGVARTAMIAGTATAVSNRVSRRQQGRWARRGTAQYDEQPAQQPHQQQVQQAPPIDMSAKMAQLKELAALKETGVLTAAEFDLQKSRLLAQ